MDTYEKKYKEALELARDYYKANLKLYKVDENVILEDIFPELAEQEDEKTRKEIVGYLKKNLRLEWATWLEKQGEQKPFDYEKVNIQQKDFAPQKDIPRYSIGDVLCDKSCTTLNKELQSNFEITDIRNGMYICDKCSFPISQQDEYELVAKRIEPTWSEDDKKHIIDIIDYLYDYYSFAKDEYKDVADGVLNEIRWLQRIQERL